MRRRTGLVAAGTALVMTLGATGAAVAAGAGSASDAGGTEHNAKATAPADPGKGTAGKDAGRGKGGSGDTLASLAKRYGVTVARLDTALRHVKERLGANGGDVRDPALVRGLVRDLGLSRQQATRLLGEVFGPAGAPGRGKPGKPGAPGKGKPGDPGKPGKPGGALSTFSAAELAKLLGVPRAEAKTALDAVAKLASGPKGSVDTAGPQFAAIARRAGVTPERLADALFTLKMAAAKPAGTVRSVPPSA